MCDHTPTSSAESSLNNSFSEDHHEEQAAPVAVSVPKSVQSKPLENVFVGISGLIGAGKSTLATALGKELNLPVYYEPVIDNEYLADFYQDLKKYGFPMQIYLLNRRFRQHQQIIWSGQGGIQDRTIYEDAVFAKMLRDSGMMEERDYRTYIDLFANMSNFMRKPNVIVHLDVTPEQSLARVQKRARDCELESGSALTLEYLTALYEAYEVFIEDISLVIPVIKVNWNEFQTTETMAAMIAEEYHKLTNIRHVQFQQTPYSVHRAFAPSTEA